MNFTLRPHGHHFPIKAMLLATALAAVATGVSAEERNATPAEAQRLMTDATIDFGHGGKHFYEYYAPDGTARSDDGSGQHRGSGHWRVRPDGTVCFLHDDPNQSGCVFVEFKGDQIEFHRIDGVVEGPFRFERGNPHGL